MSATPVSKVQSSKGSQHQNQSDETAPVAQEQRVTNKNPARTIPPLLGANLAELTQWVLSQGQPAYRGQQLHQWIYEKGARSLSDITVFSKQWRDQVADVPIGRSTIHHRSVAPDDTVKYLLRLADGQIIETVGIPTEKRLTVCVSSQVGCPMACDFCATGKGGFTRNLARHEIVDQVLTVQEDFKRRVSHIVFMGMGEPLLNTVNVLGALEILNKDVGIGQRSMTLSTVGVRDRILDLAKHHLQITLAVSLHAPNQALREKLIPTAQRYSLEDLLAECREYVQLTGRRLTFEYVLLAGVNDLPQHANELASRLRGFQTHVNLIPYNPIHDADYQRPDSTRIQAFVAALKKQHIAVSVRYSRGLEANAACGQLRASK
ncbi:23S rRNA (adenine(2503)-C(2))-methyltransferase RlmN [Coleofasciculus sp. FACHB-1120]|uniref:23S rRNA (adenine(2503)-C(2))-methyltransferase RlmN n=1 Tax=Coleofasciculus sp. FACHB-1120 TaxID=2692783 RepID=UPI0016839DFE|nr:23S rRNA (adenine(2503)-C(2))-methyltransferase RlmN [Coleofasciculus sp. FACHB-1120]MBD2744033.1 23S rRNA (adenine(2503)-C(2))-methyltransferase RlmN [Coleofasciculus sp. FACHB-1120]